MKSIEDSVYTLSKLNGDVVLINFWATWCGPCRMEIPEFNDLQKEYRKKGFKILGISVSDNKKQRLWRNFLRSSSFLISFASIAIPWMIRGLF